MIDHVFDPECLGCQPCIVDPLTGQPLPKDHPLAVTALRIWKALPREDQEALNRVWVRNGRDPADLRVVDAYAEALEKASEDN
jgi:hypothetical protein